MDREVEAEKAAEEALAKWQKTDREKTQNTHTQGERGQMFVISNGLPFFFCWCWPLLCLSACRFINIPPLLLLCN